MGVIIGSRSSHDKLWISALRRPLMVLYIQPTWQDFFAPRFGAAMSQGAVGQPNFLGELHSHTFYTPQTSSLVVRVFLNKKVHYSLHRATILFLYVCVENVLIYFVGPSSSS